MPINFFDFSVIIQGPIIGKLEDGVENQLTIRCINSIRKHLPGAEVIISTWKNEKVHHLYFDKIVFNSDPGGITYNDFELKGVYNNNNRQITTTIAGLNLATRKYSIKMRGDFYFENTNFLNFINKYNKVNSFKFFEQRVIVPTYFSRNPEKIPLLFHISDLFQIGLTKDLQSLWNIPLQPEPQTTRAYNYNVKFLNDPFRFNQYKMQFASEQYIWHQFAKSKNLNLDLDYFCQVPFKLILPATLSIIDNFVITSPQQLGINFPERLFHGEDKLYTFKEWENLYLKLCVNNLKIRKLQLQFNVCKTSINFKLKNTIKNIKQLFK